MFWLDQKIVSKAILTHSSMRRLPVNRKSCEIQEATVRPLRNSKYYPVVLEGLARVQSNST